MPGRLRRLSGNEVVTILRRFDFEIFTQRGSHVKLRRYGAQGEKQTLVVPRHEELDVGTLRAILRQASRYIPENSLQPYFYTE